MTHDHDFFTPDNVDEQVDQLSQLSTRSYLLHTKQTDELPQTAASLVEDLEAYYQSEQQEDRASIAYAWKRVSGTLPRNRDHSQVTTQPLPTPVSRAPQERIPIVRNHVSEISRGGNFSRRLGLLIAVLVATLLVGSLATIVTLSHYQSTTSLSSVQTIHAPTATSTPTPVPGKTLYTTPANKWGFESLSWSPNSQRVASSTIDPKGVQFWDATTGGHLVTLQMPGGTSEWAWNVSWSPNSDKVAVATNQHVLIVNGQTGKIISSHASGVPTANTGSTTTPAQTHFSGQIPASGGFGYRDTAWSPDGRLMASALSFGASGVVQVWNPQTDATNSTLTVGSSENIGALSWSSDGQYIAATTWNTQATDMTQPNSRVVTWNVSTHQMVFQHSDFMGSDSPVAWQPGSHNLAFVGATSSGGKQVTTTEIWNATTGKLVKQHVGAANGALAWSPDGTYLAYADYSGKKPVNVVIIMDATTGKQIYVYKEHHLSVSVIAWSPNGKYIVSAEGNTEGQMVAKVWAA